jgi:threonine/homoserine/homoserine lactone efflux protein
MSNASYYGFRKTLPFVFGAVSGFFILLIASSVFSVTLYEVVPVIAPVVSVAGAAYIFYLAWKVFTRKSAQSGEEEKAGTNSFRYGVFLQFVNPKGIVFSLSVISVYVVPYFQEPFIVLLFCAVIAITGFFCTSSWVLFGSLFQKLFDKHGKIINTVMALLLVYCGITILLTLLQ